MVNVNTCISFLIIVWIINYLKLFLFICLMNLIEVDEFIESLQCLSTMDAPYNI